MNQSKCFVLIGASFALTAVAMGAFGAHALNTRLEDLGTVQVWKTAVDYQMWHALSILLLVALGQEGRTFQIAACCFCVGVLLFSGSLYWLALGGPHWMGPITPLGGLSLIVGWSTMIVATLKVRKEP